MSEIARCLAVLSGSDLSRTMEEILLGRNVGSVSARHKPGDGSLFEVYYLGQSFVKRPSSKGMPCLM